MQMPSLLHETAADIIMSEVVEAKQVTQEECYFGGGSPNQGTAHLMDKTAEVLLPCRMQLGLVLLGLGLE